MTEFSHLDKSGRIRMVDVGDKPETKRTASAKGTVKMRPETLALLVEGSLPKGNVLEISRIAGIMAAKKTSELIPLCHPLLLSHVDVALSPRMEESALEIFAEVSLTGKTGAEMEALTAVTVAALTLYDMCKAVDRTMEISEIRVTEKSGGRSGLFRA